MKFISLKGISENNGSKIIDEILNIILGNNKDLENLKIVADVDENLHFSRILEIFIKRLNNKNYPISAYTPKRLSIALEKYKKDLKKRNLMEELLSRFYYDLCISGEKIILDYPPLLQIEIASRCNYRCVFCYQSDNTFSDPKSKYMGFMDFNLFKDLIDEIEGNIPYITFASRGEPTLHPQFLDILEYCRDKFKDIKINTNASTLNRKKIEKILDICDTLVFSIDSPDPKIYPKIRVNGNLEKVIKNINLFNRIRSNHPRNKDIVTRASGVLFNKEIQSEEDYENLFKPLFDQTAFVEYDPWEKMYTLPVNNITKPCSQPFHRFFVWFDGSYNCCDMDYKSTLSEGAIRFSKEYSLKEAWNSKIMNNIRDLHHSGKRNQIEPCKRCPLSA